MHNLIVPKLYLLTRSDDGYFENEYQDIAVSYVVGALGGLWYLRLLNKGVDSVGSGDAGGLAAQPRLLIPVVLVLGFNR